MKWCGGERGLIAWLIVAAVNAASAQYTKGKNSFLTCVPERAWAVLPLLFYRLCVWFSERLGIPTYRLLPVIL